MGLVRWFSKNWANTQEPTHPDLVPIPVQGAPGEAFETVKRAAAGMKNWRVESEAPTELKLTRRTGIIGFIDDVTVTIVPAGNELLLHAASRSRVGKGDLGQNRRNILELWSAIRAST